jgi:hypothetical protein
MRGNMTKWEYKIVNVGSNDLVGEESLILKKLGDEGWELIAVNLNSFQNLDNKTYYLKKKYETLSNK